MKGYAKTVPVKGGPQKGKLAHEYNEDNSTAFISRRRSI